MFLIVYIFEYVPIKSNNMKKSIEKISDDAMSQLAKIGQLIRQHRELFKITANVTAEAGRYISDDTAPYWEGWTHSKHRSLSLIEAHSVYERNKRFLDNENLSDSE